MILLISLVSFIVALGISAGVLMLIKRMFNTVFGTRSFWVISILLSFFVLFLIRNFVFSYAVVAGEAMSPLYHTGDILFINKLTRQYQKGDVILFHTPQSPDSLLVSRLVGLPGEDVTFSGTSMKLGSDKYFVLGDNQNESLDSRTFGPISGKNIYGKIMFARSLTQTQNAKVDASLKDSCVKELGDSADLYETKLCVRVNFLDDLREATTAGDLSRVYMELLDIVRKNWEGDAALSGLIDIWREVDENGNEELVFGGHAITKQREWSVNDGDKITQIPVSVEFHYVSGNDKFLVLAECISDVCKASLDRPIELQNLYTIDNLLNVTGETNYSHIIFIINQQTGKSLYRIYVPGGYKTFDPTTKQVKWKPLAH